VGSERPAGTAADDVLDDDVLDEELDEDGSALDDELGLDDPAELGLEDELEGELGGELATDGDPKEDDGEDDVADAAPDPEIDVAQDVLVRVVDEDEDGAVDGLREDEFICTSCFLAKGPTQLADADRLVCLDCV
jgi:hypothetical protein